MPDVELRLEIGAPVSQVWETVLDIERYPESMENVRWARIVEPRRGQVRRSAWSVTLKGSVLEWEEQERIDDERFVLDFHQLRGDMERYEGAWSLEPTGPDTTRVVLNVSFEIGIPLLADMLNPVAQRSLRENCTQMLEGIERAAVAAFT